MKKFGVILFSVVVMSCGNTQEQNSIVANSDIATEKPAENVKGNNDFGKVTELNPEDNIKYKKIILADPYEFKERYDNGSKVIDVRSAADFTAGHISGAINIELSDPEFSAKVKEYISDMPILVYSNTGVKSQQATHKMEAAGLGKIYNLEGGYSAWKAIGL